MRAADSFGSGTAATPTGFGAPLNASSFVPENQEGGGFLQQSHMTFIVSPPEIVFKGFKEHGRYEANLSFKNQTTTTQNIRLSRPEGRFFSISEPRGGEKTLKVAAGLSVSYTVYFSPEKDTDYEYDLVAFTDHERFVVPVRSIGSRGRLALPPHINLNACPIKSTSRSTILMTNSGTKNCDWRASATAPFQIVPSSGLLSPGDSQQVAVEFTPMQLMKFESAILFDLGRGETQSMKVSGIGADVDIVMDTDVLVVDKTFISLERQALVTVYNRSDTVVHYDWKEHGREEDENEAREEKLERLKQQQFGGRGVGLLGIRGMTTASGAPDHTAAATAARTFRTQRETVEKQPLYFDDDVFTIEPLHGDIPARGKREFTITFNPQLAMQYVATAYLDIQGQSRRMPLQIKGIGLGPHCALGFDNLDLGDIFINSLHQYEVVLENRGSIEAKWMLQPQSTLFGPKFKFNPSNGIIPVGTTQVIGIVFCSDIIGIVAETFRIHVQGSKDELELHFKGRVIGPTFHFDVEELDFGNVSYNFWHTKTFSIVNTSEIPMKFSLRVPEDDNPRRKEFEVVPSEGMILPHGRQKIQLDFLSNTVQEYNAHLVVDIDEVGENLDSLPIKATCIVPEIAVSREMLDYGPCFIGYPYSQEVELRNETALSAKYEIILPADDDPVRRKADVMIGTGQESEKRGTVVARSSQRISITVTAKAIGSLHIPLYVRILGADSAPHLVALSARVTGPKIDVQPRVLDFATLEVLTEHSKPVVIVNSCPITAYYSAKLIAKHPSNALPPFSLKVAEGIVKPNSSSPLHVTAYLDEAMKFDDQLVITVQHNPEPEAVQLTAKGKGFPLVPSIPLDLVDFADLFTTVPVKKTFILQNKGRRPQQVQWSNERGKAKEGAPPIVFTITPERVTLNGKSEETFTIEGLSNNKGVFSEKFVLKQNQTHKVIMHTAVQGSFQPPLLTYSTNAIAFSYHYDATSTTKNYVFTKPLTMKNVSPLSLDFNLKIQKPSSSNEAGAGGNLTSLPFTIDKSDFSLKSGESTVVNVAFDASYRGDRVSHVSKTKLTVNFSNHAQKDNISLNADIQFPNVVFDVKEIDFGCVLNDTEHRKTVVLANPSPIPVAFTWAFEEDSASSLSVSTINRRSRATDVAVPINNVFDVVPFRGLIPPNSSADIEVIFNGIPGRKFGAVAVCQVEGGPDYPVSLQGEASSMHFKFDKVSLDFDAQDFDKWGEREIFITNTGKVPFPFRVDLSILSRPGMLEVSPMSGIVAEKVRLVVRFCPGVPDNVDENFKVQVAHFEPQIINVKGHGSYSSLLVTAVGVGNFVSRNEAPAFDDYYRDAKAKISDVSFRPFTTVNGRPSEGVVIDPAMTEAERLFFRDTVIDDSLLQRAVASGEVPAIPEEQLLRIKRKTGNESKYILARYTVDLGSVIKGDTKKKSFRVTNTSAQTILYAVDRKQLANSPILLSPDKFTKLPALANQLIEVAINTKLKTVNIGPFEQEIIIEIKGGSLVLLNVTALVVLPQLKVSSDSLDFGTVLVGMTRIISIMIENEQPLPCEWHATFVDDRNKRIPADVAIPFYCKPDRGVLLPNTRFVLEISFAPFVAAMLNYKVLIRLSSNPKPVEISLTGVGEVLNVTCEPTVLSLAPVFPFHVSRKNFTVVNNSSVPVEVFSLEFDEKYLIEEDILRNAEECFTNDVLLLPPRDVGASLPDHLMECYYAKLLANDRKFAALDFVPSNDEMQRFGGIPTMEVALPIGVGAGGIGADGKGANATQSNAAALPPLEAAAEAYDPIRPTLVLMVGPSMSGKTTHSRRLCESHGLLRVSLSDVVSVALETDGPDGAAMRSVLQNQLFPPPPPQPSTANQKESKMSKAEQQRAAQAAAEAAARAEISAGVLMRAVAQRLRQKDAAGGVVIDDLICPLTNSVELMLTAVRDAAAAAGFALVVLDFAIDAMLGDLRRATDTMQALLHDADSCAVQPLTDEAYDHLSLAAKRSHDVALKRQRDSKKALKIATETVELLQEQRQEVINGSALQTLQEEVDREVAAAKESEDPKTKKKPVKQKEAEALPIVDWDNVRGAERFKKVYELLRTLFDDNVHKVIHSDAPVDDVHMSVLTSTGLPPALARRKTPPSTAPAVTADAAPMELPAPQLLQRIQRPKDRRNIRPPKFFKILTPVIKEAPPPVVGKDGKKGKQTQQQPQESWEERTRWIIQPNASVDLTVYFCCDDIGPHATELSLGIVGSTQQLGVVCRAASSYPDVIREVKSLFPPKKLRAQQAALDAKYPAKIFISALKRYEFGPLLISPSPTAMAGQSKKEKPKGGDKGASSPDISALSSKGAQYLPNTEVLKFTNSGAFPATINFSFENPQDKCFVLQQDTIHLDVGQSDDIFVVAQPDAVADFMNALIVTIKDNPEPLKIDFSCTGTRPALLLNGKKDLSVEFGRMLVRKKEVKMVNLKSDCKLPLRWRIVGIDKLPPEVTLDAVNGLLEPEKDCTITIAFLSERTAAFNVPLKVEVTDALTETGKTTYESLPLLVKAEAHDIIMEWTKELDFKTVRVGEVRKEKIRMLNKGPYEVAFQFKLPPRLAEVIQITPMEGSIRGMQGFKDAAIVLADVTFKALKEVNINPKRFGDLELVFLEPASKKLVCPPQIINVRAESLHHKFSIKPQHLNFGPCMYRQRKTATFEITNSGCFELKYRMYNFKDGIAKALEPPAEPEATKKKPAEKKAKKGHEAEPIELSLNSFTVSPALGVVTPGTTAVISVSITPEGNSLFEETLGIYFEDANLSGTPEGIPVQLEAESCVPGIIADLESPDSDTIFEEQQIVPRLDAFRKIGHVYSREDRCFSFGLALSGRRQQERLRLTNPTKVPATVQLRIAPRGDAPDAKASCDAFDVLEARLNGGRLTIPAHEHRYVNVVFSPASLNVYSAFFDAIVENGLDPKTKQLRLELRGEGSLPNVLVDIPPPPVKAIDVTLPQEANNTGKNVKSKGGAKTVKSDKQAQQAADDKDGGANALVLNRTIVGTSSSRAITVRNVGDLPATIRFNVPTATCSRCISFPSRNEDFTLLPGTIEKYSVFFEPNTVGTFQSKIVLSVQDNHYEDTVISVVGEGYFEPITFEDMDENTENSLALGDCYIGVPRTRTFTIKSHEPRPIRFAWTTPNTSMMVSPACGYLLPGSKKSISVTFTGTGPSQDTARCTATLQAIASDTVVAEWDSSMKNTKWVQENISASPASVMSDAGTDEDAKAVRNVRRPMRRVHEPVPEPTGTIIEGPLGTKDILVSFSCDHTQWEVALSDDFPISAAPAQKDGAHPTSSKADKNALAPADASTTNTIVGSLKHLSFAMTKILQHRTTPILIKNTGKVKLPFHFAVEGPRPDVPVDAEEVDTFTVEPASGEVAPGHVSTIIAKYIPRATGEHHHTLVATFPHGNRPELRIPVTGSAECPLVHFELPQAEYYQTRRVDRPPIEANVCVVEFFSHGVRIRNSVRFMVVNPSNMSYDFEWSDHTKNTLFKCSTMRGTIHSGKKYEMIFEYSPEGLECQESNWSFRIPQHNTVIPFLLVGWASEPELFFSKSKIDFGHVIVGARSKHVITIENRESIPYPYQFDAIPPGGAVALNPMSGVIPPSGAAPVEITFMPTTEDPYNYTFNCNIKKALAPLTVNIKGEGYMTHDTLRLQEPSGSMTTLSSTAPSIISLPVTQVNGSVTRRFVLSNDGRFNIDYKWQVPPNNSISFSNLLGTVLPGSTSNVDITFSPQKEGRVSDFKMICKVTNGNTYTVVLNAVAANPNVAFSFEKFDFGPCFLYTPLIDPSTAVLTVMNRDKISVSVDALFDNKDYLEIDVASFVLAAGEKRDIRITFYPRDTVLYAETIQFSLNDLTKASVAIMGEGTVPKVDVGTKVIRFGAAQVGEKKEAEIRVQCRSKITTPFSLENCLTPDMIRAGLSVFPDGPILLKPKETRAITVSFKPPTRMRPFNFNMNMIVLGREQPMAQLIGSCQGSEVHLDCKSVSFGSVVVGTKVVRRLTILNSGDVSLDFAWTEKRLGHDFTVIPASGIVQAHSEFRCELIYEPQEICKDAKREIEVRFNDAPSLPLLITGTNCVERPPLTDVLNFACRVRETSVQKVVIKNDSGDNWTLRPAISNTAWTVPDTFVVRARDATEFPITYAPTICTKNRADSANDQGTLFIALPTGNALLYRLDGAADVPAVAAPPIERDVVAKTAFTERLVVSNWLPNPQKFVVSQQWTHDLKDESVSVKGVPTIDVPPNATRDYKLTFSSFKEGRFTGTVNFVNEETKEYQYYQIAFNVKPAKETSALEFRTPARQRLTKTITISNPLAKPVTLTSKCDLPELYIPASVVIPAKCDSKIAFEFCPLLVKEYQPLKIVFTSQELGDFPYTLNLACTPAVPEKPHRLTCALGQCISTTLRFIHYCKNATEFAMKFGDAKQSAFFKSSGSGGVKVNACPDPRAGQEAVVDITFEPSRIGEFKETLELVSSTGGIYTFPLFGVCTPPQRQGPIEIKPNAVASISFKNVFNEAVSFQFSTDDPQFIIPKTSEQLPAKKTTTISVQYKGDDTQAVARGKLTITAGMGENANSSNALSAASGGGGSGAGAGGSAAMGGSRGGDGSGAGGNANTQGLSGQQHTWVYYLRGLKESEVVAQQQALQQLQAGSAGGSAANAPGAKRK